MGARERTTGSKGALPDAGAKGGKGVPIEAGPGARAAAAAASKAAKAARESKGPEDPVDAALLDLASEDRSKRLNAIFALGEAFSGAGAPDAALEPAEAKTVARVVERLEAILADRVKGASWTRKRAKRALKKIRTAADEVGALGDMSDDAEASEETEAEGAEG